MSSRDQVIEIARRELETGDPTGGKYWRALGLKPPIRSWCGVFALWCLREAGLTARTWTPVRGFIYVDDAGTGSRVPYLRPTKHPQPGDVAYYLRKQHYALVEEPRGGLIATIDGNQPGIKRRERLTSAAYTYFSIASLLPPELPNDPVVTSVA